MTGFICTLHKGEPKDMITHPIHSQKKHLAYLGQKTLVTQGICHVTQELPLVETLSVYEHIEERLLIGAYLEEFVILGEQLSLAPIEELFIKVKEVGAHIESELVTKRQGTHSYRGIIFILGVLLSNYGRLYRRQTQVSLVDLRKSICEMMGNMCEDVQTKTGASKCVTSDEYTHIDKGIKGIRGEARLGFPGLFECGLPYYLNHSGTTEEKIKDTVLFLSLNIEDTSLIRSLGVAPDLAHYEEMVCPLFEQGGNQTEEGRAYYSFLMTYFRLNQWEIGESSALLLGILLLEQMILEGYISI